MSAHTPGPWIWADNHRGLYGAGKENAVLDYFHYEGMHLGLDHKEANARLIAAAPELLAAAKWAASYLDTFTESMALPVLSGLLEAIAKATGSAS